MGEQVPGTLHVWPCTPVLPHQVVYGPTSQPPRRVPREVSRCRRREGSAREVGREGEEAELPVGRDAGQGLGHGLHRAGTHLRIILHHRHPSVRRHPRSTLQHSRRNVARLLPHRTRRPALSALVRPHLLLGAVFVGFVG